VGGIAARRFAQGKGLSRVERCVVLGAGPTRLAAFFPRALASDLVPGSEVAGALAAPPPEGTRITSVRGADEAVVLPPGADAVPRPGVDFLLESHGHFALLASEKAWRAVKAAVRRGGEEEREESTQEAALRAMAELSR
jgi:hypothetical protein